MNVNDICPFCHKAVAIVRNRDRKLGHKYDDEYLIRGHGVFREKQYFHCSCFKKYVREVNNK